jgi:hypothetical protein
MERRLLWRTAETQRKGENGEVVVCAQGGGDHAKRVSERKLRPRAKRETKVARSIVYGLILGARADRVRRARGEEQAEYDFVGDAPHGTDKKPLSRQGGER